MAVYGGVPGKCPVHSPGEQTSLKTSPVIRSSFGVVGYHRPSSLNRQRRGLQMLRKLAAELLGTLILVFIACGVATLSFGKGFNFAGFSLPITCRQVSSLRHLPSGSSCWLWSTS